jgi:hypothetical protein
VFNMFQCWTPNTDTCDHIQLIHFFQIFTGVDVSVFHS